MGIMPLDRVDHAASEQSDQRTQPPKSTGVRRLPARAPLRVVIALLLFIEIYPLVWLFLSSLKANNEFSLNPMWALPQGIHWQNYVDAFTEAHMGVYFVNSILTVFPSLFLIIVL